MGKDLHKEDEVRYLSLKSPAHDIPAVIKLQTMNSNSEHKKSHKRLFASRERGKVGTREINVEPVTMMQEENYKEMRRDRKKDTYKSLNIRTKKLSNKLDELKKVYTSNLSVSSPTRINKAELSTFSPKHYKKYKLI